jgi:hypothetical protein
VFWDRFAQPNYNSVILARSGAGKRYLAKLELLRSLYFGARLAGYPAVPQRVVGPMAGVERRVRAVRLTNARVVIQRIGYRSTGRT